MSLKIGRATSAARMPVASAPAPMASKRMPAEMRRQHGRGIGADAEETGVAEADLAGKADQQVEAEDDDRVDRHADRQIECRSCWAKRRADDQDHRATMRRPLVVVFS